jgi:hypothetical protein
LNLKKILQTQNAGDRLPGILTKAADFWEVLLLLRIFSLANIGQHADRIGVAEFAIQAQGDADL